MYKKKCCPYLYSEYTIELDRTFWTSSKLIDQLIQAIATPTTYQGNINRAITFPKAVQPSVYKSAIAYQPAPYTLNTAETAARTGARAAPTAVPRYVRANNLVVHNSNNNIQQVRPNEKPVYNSRIVYLNKI